MRPTSSSRCLASIAICTLMISASPTHAQTPTGSRWWPSEWGPDDQRVPPTASPPPRLLRQRALYKEGKIYLCRSKARPAPPGSPIAIK